MKLIDWAGTHLRARKIIVNNEKSGWVRIPNIEKFQINLGKYHPMLRLIGIKKRTPAKLEFSSLSSGKSQRYMEYQLRRLQNLRQDPDKYWKVSLSLLRRSHSFRVSAINHVFRNWYKAYSFWFILNVNRKVDQILRRDITTVDFKRVYIDKSDGRKRPLGVPKPEWRLLLHMLNNFIQWNSPQELLTSQHGFIPGRGTLTAWKEILREGILAKRNIYECDLTNFFNEVSLDAIDRRLKRMGTPQYIVQLLRKLNMSTPKLPAIEELDETPVYEKRWEQMRKGKVNKEDDLKAFLSEKTTSDQFPKSRGYEIMVRSIFGLGEWKGDKGVPQGSPTSPFLSILTLEKFLTQQDSISYADDPIFYSDKPFKIKDNPSEGIIIQKQKSRWVKKAGKWLHPLKFLGIEYDGINNTLKAKTREGATLEVSGTTKEMLEAISEWENENGYIDSSTTKNPISGERALHSWKQLWSSRLAGFIQACMYKNSWTDTVYQDFELKFGGSSWLGLRPAKHPQWSTFTVSSYATSSLLQTLSNRRRKWRSRSFTGIRFVFPRGRPSTTSK